MEPRQRAREISELISATTKGKLSLLSSTTSVLVHALGNEDVVIVVADGETLEWEGHTKAVADIALMTVGHVAFVHFDGAAVRHGPSGIDDDPTVVTILPRSAIESVTVDCPQIWRKGRGGDFDFEELPWGTTLRAHYRGREQPLIVRDVICNVPLTEVQAMLLKDLANAR